MKRYISLFLSIFVISACLFSFGCRKKVNPALEIYEGWWQRPDGYSSEEKSFLSDKIEIKADEASVTCYSEYGVASEKYSCVSEENTLVIFIEAFGEIRFVLKEEALVNAESGKVEYVKGEPAEEIDVSVFCGKWYRSGDTKSDYYEITETGYSFYYANITTAAIHSGMWESTSVLRCTPDGKSYDEVILKLLNLTVTDTFRKNYEYAFLAGGIVLYDNLSSEFYVRENAIKQGKADRAIAEMMLVSEEWTGEGENPPYISFDLYSSSFTYNTPELNDGGTVSYSQNPAGSWTLDDGKLLLEFSDGKKETVVFEKNTAAVKIEKYGMTFTRDKW